MNHIHFTDKKKSTQFFFLIWIVYAIVYMTKNCFSAAMASIVFEGIMTKSQTGLITALFYAVYTPLQIVGGFAADRFDPHKLIKLGLVGGGIANLILFFNQNYYLVLVVWVLNAAVQFGVWPSVFKIVSSQLEISGRKRAVYFLSFETAIGMTLAYLIAVIVPRWYDHFLVSAVLLFASALALHIAGNKMKPYTEPDEPAFPAKKAEKRDTQSASGARLFWESGFYLLLTVTFLRVIVLTCTKTLSATMLMESYDGVSPSIGNILNIVILLAGLLTVMIVKTALYPKRIKSAPVGIVLMIALTFAFALALPFVGRIPIALIMPSLCVMAGCLTTAQMFSNYCSLYFEKFGKSGIASGVTNAISSFSIVVNSYGVTRAVESFNWQTVGLFFVIVLAIALALSLIILPVWNRFEKKYASMP